MARWGMGDQDEELARVRVLRARGVGLTQADPKRRETFGAALEQFEQLLRSADASPPTTAPLPLFYALSQAGRAIAAAHHPDRERWRLRGHGLQGPPGAYPSPIGDAELKTVPSGRGAFRVVSEATGSPWTESQTFRLTDLWASLPQITCGDGLGDGSLKPIQPSRQSSPHKAPWTFRADAGSGQDLVKNLMRRYPAFAEGDAKLIIQEDPQHPGWVTGGIFVPLGSRRLEETAETYLSDSTVYVRPAIAGSAPPSILMTWWAVLFALSQLARYEPATWTSSITPDRSVLTVPVEDALRQAGRIMPRLVLHALVRHWRE